MYCMKNSLLEMDNELYVAAMNGDVKFLETKSDEYLLKKTTQKNNILHIATRNEKTEFIEALLKRFPNNRELLYEGNSKENTPLHIAAEAGNIGVVKVLYEHLFTKTSEGGTEKPWMRMRMRNLEGNTPAHVAIIHGNAEIAMLLLNKDPGLADIVNEFKEAPLHLAVKNPLSHSQKKDVKARVQGQINREGETVDGEDMSGIIQILVEQAGYVTCWLDGSGCTPLLKAASLSPPYNREIITLLVEQWPLATEVCDNSGNSILHLLVNKLANYIDCKYLLDIKQILELRDSKDHQGNTPLHIAASNMDIKMVRALLDSGANPDIINMEGISATFVIQQQNIIKKLKTRIMKVEECEAAEKGNIDFLKERLRTLGIDFLYSQDSNGQNVLHKLFKLPFKMLQTGERDVSEDVEIYVGFVEQVLSTYPAIVGQTDCNGDTPIHVLVQNNVNYREEYLLIILLELCNKFICEMEEEAKGNNNNNDEGPYEAPWLVQNVDGNTPLHLALDVSRQYTKLLLVRKLAEYNKRPNDYPCNKHGETIYHLVGYHTYLLSDHLPPLEGRRPKDQDGFTPLMRAIQHGCEETATRLLDDDKVFWWFKLLVSKKSEDSPLHTAIQHKQSKLIGVMLERVYEESDKFLKDNIANYRHYGESPSELIKIKVSDDLPNSFIRHYKNEAGETAWYLLGELEDIDPELEKQILSNPRLRGIRSSWGIPKSQLQNYMSSVNVIAALLTTITFTAAFAVPGGLDQDNGTPVLLSKSRAFQWFMVTDVIAMCLSMMVLFCLLWIVATKDKHKSVIIQDFAVTLLLASFFATLLTFTAGVYATVYPVEPKIAFAALVLCSLLGLSVHRSYLIDVILPLKNVIQHPIYSAKSLYRVCFSKCF